MKKIYNLDKLKNISVSLKKKSKKIVLCHGVFDLLHIGHIKHLKKAKEYGNKLFVTITSDKFVNKGPGKPVFNERLRAEALASLEDVDYVAINDSPTAINAIKIIKPDFYCKGRDYVNPKDDITGEIKNELKQLKKNKGKIIFTHELTFSSSRTINTQTDFYSEIHKKQINKIKKKYNFVKIKNIIDKFNDLKILVIGETIIDQYNFCEAIGKSGKEPILVLKELNSENFLGGVLAIARNMSKFSDSVNVLSALGEKKDFLKEIKSNLSKKIKCKFFYKKNSPTIIKRRYVDDVSKSKLFGVYNLNDNILSKKEELEFNNYLKNELKKYDLVVVSDYGHGLISKESANIICKHSKFLALNAQVNAFNIGYHTMKNYIKFNTLIINEKEIRHEMRDRISYLNDLIVKLSKEMKIENLIVTRGSDGSILYNNKKRKFIYGEAYASKVIDKIGAGDTMLSVISLCLKSKIDIDLSLIISSLAAAQSVENLANKDSISKLSMLKTLENILK